VCSSDLSEALASLREIAADVARSTTDRLIGVEPGADEAAKVVDAAMRGSS